MQARFCPRCGYTPGARSAAQANPESPMPEISPASHVPVNTDILPPPEDASLPAPAAPVRVIQPRVKRTPLHTAQSRQPPSQTRPPAEENELPAHLRSLSPAAPARFPQAAKPHTSQFKRLRYQTPTSVPNPANLPETAHSAGQPGPQQPPHAQTTPPDQRAPAPPTMRAVPVADQQTRRFAAEPTRREQIAEQPTGQLPAEAVKPHPALITSDYASNAASFGVTSRAAERWRTSWRDRQYLEEQPAAAVSRGQSAVPEPLSVMQQSLARMRAIAAPQRAARNQENSTLSFWIGLVLMVCLIGGLGAFIISSYVPDGNSATQVYSTQVRPPPGLTLEGQQTASITQGQTLHIHGENFSAGAPIIFLLDNTTAISGANGQQIALITSDQGSFDAALPVTAQWPSGPHLIVAENNKSGQSAYLSITINPAPPSASSTASASLSANSLLFQTRIGQDNPREQFVALTAASAVQWTASAGTDNHLSWLAVDPNTVSGNLSSGARARVGVEVMAAGLPGSTTPYTGQVVFTINQTGQLTLPVKLYVHDSVDEIVISPNPLIGIVSQAGNTCQNGAALTLVNLGNAAVNWTLSLDAATARHIQFTAQGNPAPQGRLSPAGQPGDTQVLALQCKQVQSGAAYQFTVTANGTPWVGTVSIQTAA